jgi:hypothetical protein
MGTKAYDNALDLITFSRASGGTALRKISYGSELVTNGTFDTDTTGAIPATWTTNNANASLIKQADGTALFSSTSFAYAKIQDASRPVLPVGVYEVSFDITDWVAGLTLVHVGINSSGNIIGGNGSYSYLYTSTVEQAYEFQIRPNGGGTGSFKIDNISVKEVLFDQPDGTLTLFNHPNNIPRIDYNTDGTVKGLLIEEARTNFLTYSEDFANASWARGRTTVSLNETGPDGVSNSAVTFSDDNSTGTNSVYLSNSVTVSAATTYTSSIFAKADQLSLIHLRAVNFTTPSDGGAWFDLSAGTIGTTNTGIAANIEAIGGGWYRCSITFTTDAADTSGDFRVYPAETDGSLNVALDGTSSILIYGAQFERGSFPTSYIPTSGATATRAADIASIPVTDFGYNQKAGTVVVEFDSNGSDGADYPRVFSLSNTSGTDLTRFLINPTNTTTVAVITAGSGVALAGWSGSISENTTETVAVAIKKDSFAASLSGASTQEDTSGNMPAASNILAIGTQSNLGNNFLNGHIKSIQYYPRRLTNTQLQELTA